MNEMIIEKNENVWKYVFIFFPDSQYLSFLMVPIT